MLPGTATVNQMSHSSSMKQLRITCDVTPTVLQGSLGGSNLVALVDTGAVCNIVSRSVVGDKKLTRASHPRRFITANNTILEGGTHGIFLHLRFTLLDRNDEPILKGYRAFFYVADLSTEAIIGYRFLIQNRIGIAPHMQGLLDLSHKAPFNSKAHLSLSSTYQVSVDPPDDPRQRASGHSPSLNINTASTSGVLHHPRSHCPVPDEPTQSNADASSLVSATSPTLHHHQTTPGIGATRLPDAHSMDGPSRSIAVAPSSAQTLTLRNEPSGSSTTFAVESAPSSSPGGGIREVHSYSPFFAVLDQPLDAIHIVDHVHNIQEAPKWTNNSYRITKEWFDKIKKWSGLDLTIDAFASEGSNLLSRWWSRSQDAFEQPWDLEVLWVNPPIQKLPDVITKIIQDEAEGVILAPIQEASWFRALCYMARNWWDIPSETSLFEDDDGRTLDSKGWRWRAVHFNAAGLQEELRQHLPLSQRRDSQAFKISEDTWITYVHSPSKVNSVIEVGPKAESAEVEAARKEIFEKYSHVLLEKEALRRPRKPDPTKRGPYGLAKIELVPDAKPFKGRPFRLPADRLEGLKGKIADFLHKDWIEEAPATEWSAIAFVVPKPDGTWRVVIDYRNLNGQTKTDTYPLPIIEDCIARQGRCGIFSVADAADGFHQMELEEESRPLTAFFADDKVYQWKVMPMGIKNGPSMFQRLMKWATRSQPRTDVYVDDLLTGSTGNTHQELVENHKKDLCHLLDALAAADLVMKKAKTELFVTEVKFCGHVLSNGTRRPAPSKLAAVEQWDPADIKTVTHLRSFIGLCQWYEIYIPNYAQVATPLTDALKGMENSKKSPPIHMTDEMIDSVNKLKSLLKDHVVLDVVDPAKPFVIRVDASGYAIGGALEQAPSEGALERPIAFFSRKLTGSIKDRTGQCGWTPREQETYALVVGLAKFQSWIGGQQVYIKAYSDHKSIESWHSERLDCKSGPLGRRGRWHEFFSRFPNLEVRYVKGKDNPVADYLSRWAYPACEVVPDETFHGSREDAQKVKEFEKDEARLDSPIASVDHAQLPTEEMAALILADGDLTQGPVHIDEVQPEVSDLIFALEDAYMREEVEAWVMAYEACPELSEHYTRATNEHNTEPLEGWAFERGRLRRNGKIYVPTSLAQKVIEREHAMAHPGIEKTLAMLNRRYVFPGTLTALKERVKETVRNCDICQATKPNNALVPDERTYHFVPETVFSSLTMDFVKLPPVDYRGQHLDQALVIVCRTSGFIYAHPCRMKGFTGRDTAQLFYDRVFHFMGLPNEIYTASDIPLANNFFQTVCALSGVDRALCTQYRPNSNGRAERAVKSLVEALRKTLAEDEYTRTWPEVLPLAVYTINTLPGVFNTLSPWEIVFGRPPIGLGDIPSIDTDHLSYKAEAWTKRMINLQARVAKKVMAYHEAEARRFHGRRPAPRHYARDDLVLVRRREHERGKLESLWVGPGKVLRRLHTNTYRVRLPEDATRYTDRQVTSDDMKPWLDRTHVGQPKRLHYIKPRRAAPVQHPIHTSSSSSQSSQSAPPPLAERKPAYMLKQRADGRILIRWSGCGPEEDTWVTPRALTKFIPCPSNLTIVFNK